MNEEDIRPLIFSLLKKIAPDTEPEKLQPDDDIREQLMIDSFDFLRFIVELDKHFGIQTPEEDYGKIRSMKNLVTYISTEKNKSIRR